MWTELTATLIDAGTFTGTQVFELADEDDQREFEVNVSAVHQNERLTGYVIVFHDVTSIKDLSRLKTHMLRMASHDLKNPLGVIEGYIELIRADTEQGEMPDPRCVEGITAAAGRMHNLIEELLDADRIDRETRLLSGLIRPGAVIREIVDEFRPQLQQKNLTLATQIKSDLLPLRGNLTQVRQAMVNLLSNAIKYTPPGGTITVSATERANTFSFSVQDTGIGIPKALQSDLFQRGYRAMREGITGIEGSGMGLSLVAEICRRHRGGVWFNSEEGVGSTFGFWLPISTD
jgi:signal transduction histidine kinase